MSDNVDLDALKKAYEAALTVVRDDPMLKHTTEVVELALAAGAIIGRLEARNRQLETAREAAVGALAKFSEQVNEKSQASLNALVGVLAEYVDDDVLEYAVTLATNAAIDVHNRQVAEASQHPANANRTQGE